MKKFASNSSDFLNEKPMEDFTKEHAVIEKTFEAGNLRNLLLELVFGDIILIGHEENTIRLEIFVSKRTIKSLFMVVEPVLDFNLEALSLSTKISGDTLKIFSSPNSFHLRNGLSLLKPTFRVHVPKHILSVSRTWGGKVLLKNLIGEHKITTWGGMLTIEDCEGKLTGKTMGGKVNVTHCEGIIKANTLGGNIHLADNQADINIDTTGGKIIVEKHKGDIHATTWGGNIESSDVYGSFECNTAGGNIYLKNNNGNIGVSTKGGNITADVPYINQYAWFDTAGGNIETTLPLDMSLDLEVSGSKVEHPAFLNFTGQLDEQNIKGKLNGGGANVTIKTRGGKITLKNQVLTRKEDPEQQANPYNYATKKTPEENTDSQTYNFSKTEEPKEKKTFSINTDNFFFALLFCLLMGYGLNSITYFTLEFVNPKSVLSNLYKGIFFSNIANGFAAVGAVYTFINLLDSKIRRNGLKYVVLILITAFYLAIFQTCLYYSYWSKIDILILAQDRNNDGKIYAFLPIVVSCVYFYYWQRTRSISRKISEQEYQLLNLEKLKSKAQLDALEARINPHFLYNSLNSIAGLIYEMPEKAEEMTIQLSKLFRYTTGRNEDNFHTIADEMEIIKSYLAIEQVRFGKRLQYSIDCDDEILPYRIPRFLLQPLVENAIKHGISKVAHDGKIRIEIHRNKDTVYIEIHDNGPDFGELLGGGFGLRSIREKLKLVYADRATFDIKNEPEKAVIIILPAN